jgi:ATP-binding cassette subfamily F protein uup
LEDLLLEYRGTVLLVSHDRSFLNHVVTGTLAFEGQGRIIEYPGGYDDWLAQRPAVEQGVALKRREPSAEKRSASAEKPKKLGYMQVRELSKLPARIEALEAEQQQIHQEMADPAFYKRSKADIVALHSRLAELDAAIAAAYARWEELEALSG